MIKFNQAFWLGLGFFSMGVAQAAPKDWSFGYSGKLELELHRKGVVAKEEASDPRTGRYEASALKFSVQRARSLWPRLRAPRHRAECDPSRRPNASAL